MKKTLLFLFLIFVLPSASAFIQTNIYVDEIGDALFLGVTDELVNLPGGVSVTNGRISGVSSELTAKNGELWTFEYNLEGAEMNVVLPDGAVIKSLSNGEIFLDRTQIAVFAVDGVKIEYAIERGASSDNSVLSAIIIIVMAVAAIFFLMNYLRKGRDIKKEMKEENKNKLDAVKEVLNEREKIIVDALKKTGKIKGSFLRKQCDIPKASFSRHLQELEKKGLIKRTGEGKNKFVELVE